MSDRIRRWFGVVCVVAAVLAPGAASAQSQDPWAGWPMPRIEHGPRGITIIPMPGVLPVIRIPGNFQVSPQAPATPPYYPQAAAPVAPYPQAPQAAPYPYPQQPQEPPYGYPEPAPLAPSGAGGRTVGIFVGISDYPSNNDLEFCASDATRVQQAFVNAGIIAPTDTIVLTDRQATRTAVANSIERLARQLSANDTLVFFFSGHGGQEGDANRDELDGQDETIVLVDGSITDDEMTQLLAAGRQREFVALDSCYSGGFSRDIARLSDSAGFYASREDQVSYVADELQAGGYLSYHLAESIQRSQGRPLSMWGLQRDVAEGFTRSGTAGRQDLTVGMSQSVSNHTVLFSREQPPMQVASQTYAPGRS